MTLEEEKALVNTLLEYEICGSWWAWMVPTDIAAGHFARKVMRKYNRMNSVKKLREKQL